MEDQTKITNPDCGNVVSVREAMDILTNISEPKITNPDCGNSIIAREDLPSGLNRAMIDLLKHIADAIDTLCTAAVNYSNKTGMPYITVVVEKEPFEVYGDAPY